MPNAIGLPPKRCSLNGFYVQPLAQNLANKCLHIIIKLKAGLAVLTFIGNKQGNKTDKQSINIDVLGDFSW